MQRPELVQYLDYRAFLAAWFSWKKESNPRFSHRLFARMTGQSNPSLLLQIMQGKRNLTARTTESYIKAMSLGEDEAEQFRLLVRFDQARTPAERTECFERLSAMRGFQTARKLEGDSFRYLSRWYFVGVRELALCPGFRADPAWIATTLRPAISEEEAADALQLLQDLGMIVLEPDGSVRVEDPTLATPHEVRGLAAYNYHRAMMDLAISCLDRVEPAERHVGAVTIAVSEEMIPLLKHEVAALQERMLELAASHSNPDRVYQITLQVFPLSHPASGGSDE